MPFWWDGPDPTKAVVKEEPKPVDPRRAMLKWFSYGHLREDLQKFSSPFSNFAAWMVTTLPPGPQADIAMQKLLEAKDAALRAVTLDAPGNRDDAIDKVIQKVMEPAP